MKTTIEWLDQAKTKPGLSDYALAPLLGVSRSQMSKYRTGKDFLSDDAAIKLAALLGMKNAAPIIASAHAERAKTDEARRFWEKLAGAAIGAVLAVGIGSTPPPAAAATTGANSPALYIMSNGRKRKRRSALRVMADLLGAGCSLTPRLAGC